MNNGISTWLSAAIFENTDMKSLRERVDLADRMGRKPAPVDLWAYVVRCLVVDIVVWMEGH